MPLYYNTRTVIKILNLKNHKTMKMHPTVIDNLIKQIFCFITVYRITN